MPLFLRTAIKKWVQVSTHPGSTKKKTNLKASLWVLVVVKVKIFVKTDLLITKMNSVVVIIEI